MSRLCRLKTKSHGEDGLWAYNEITQLRATIEKLQAIRREFDVENTRLLVENEKLRKDLATAEQRVAEACAALCADAKNKSRHSLIRSKLLIAEGKIRDGEWRKHMKGGV